MEWVDPSVLEHVSLEHKIAQRHYYSDWSLPLDNMDCYQLWFNQKVQLISSCMIHRHLLCLSDIYIKSLIVICFILKLKHNHCMLMNDPVFFTGSKPSPSNKPE